MAARRKSTAPVYGPSFNENDGEAKGAAALGRVDGEALLKARRAIERSRRMVPGLTSLARAFTKDPETKVVMRGDISSSMTDGKTFWIKPDIALGDSIEHDRRLCSQVGDDELQLCRACQRMDDVSAKFHHEVSHRVFGTFDQLTDDQKLEIVRRTVAERGQKAGTRAAKLLERMQGASYMSAANLISPYLPMLINALEDARVNRSMFKVRPGLERMNRAHVRAVAMGGQTLEDGTNFQWINLPVDMQVLIGLYLLAEGYDDFLTGFDEDVQKALADPNVRVMLMGIANAKTIETVFESAFPVLEKLREYGYCKRSDDVEDDEPPKPQPKPTPKPQPKDEDGEAEPQPKNEDGEAPGAEESDDDEDQQGLDGDDEDEAGKGASDEDEEAQQEAESDEAGAGGDDESDEAGDEDDEDDAGGQGEADEDSDEEAGGAGDEEADEDEDAPTGSFGGSGSAGNDGDDDEEAADEADGSSEEVDLDELNELLDQLKGHDNENRVFGETDELDNNLLAAAEVQFDSFEDSSPNIFTVNVIEFDKPTFTPSGADRGKALGWNSYRRDSYWVTHYEDQLPQVAETDLGRAVQKARLVFAENRAGHDQRFLRSGRLDRGRLHAVRTGDTRVFQQRSLPGRRDYAALLGLDISGSTGGERIVLIKRMAYAMGECFHRTGVGFSMYAHTAWSHDFRGKDDSDFSGYTVGSKNSTHLQGWMEDVDIHVVKRHDEAWAAPQKHRLDRLTCAANNLDGHTLEWYRKTLERQQAQSKLLFYVTDGAMPASNPEEELRILQREIATCRKLGIHLIGIGINTDSPKEHGLDTIQVDGPEDLPRLITEVERRLTR